VRSQLLKFGKLSKALNYFEFLFRTFFYLKKQNVDSVSCHNLFVLPVGVLLKKFGYIELLVFNAHELESEQSGHNYFVRSISKIIEKLCIYQVDEVTVVSPSIVRWYEETYGIENVHLLRNIPLTNEKQASESIYRELFTIPDDALVFVYQGAIGYGRGVDILLSVFGDSNCTHHLVFMGYGNFVDKVISASHEAKNIHYLPAVEPDEIIKYSSGADVGLCLIENVSLSNYFSLPNKLFEYLHSGLPVIVSDFPDMGDVVDTFDCGWSTRVEFDSVKKCISNLTHTSVLDKKNGVHVACAELNWDKEQHVLLSVFEDKRLQAQV